MKIKTIEKVNIDKINKIIERRFKRLKHAGLRNSNAIKKVK